MASAAETRIPATERVETTRDRVVQAARELVIERGYSAVSTADVQARAGVSRGGLHHHFSGKDELMAAVLETVERDILARLAAVLDQAPDPFRALDTGAQWYLDECLRSKELRRVGLYEGRKALGWESWRDTMAPYGLSLLTEALDAAIAAGQVKSAEPGALAHMILAIVHEAAMMIITAEQPDRERQRVGQAVAVMIEGLRSA